MKSSKQGKSRMHGLLAESVDSIRATLIHTTLVDSPRVVLVTSADACEGKTTVASQLAASLARCGKRTLLVDGDLRHPAAHRIFELPQEPGLCELLRRQIDGEAAVHPTLSPNLWVMPAGRCDVHSVQALSGDSLAQAASAWRSHYEFVIIDSAPVLKVADPLLFGQHVDTTILSVLRDVSQTPRVFEASERLRSVGISVLGAVVNGVNEQVDDRTLEVPLLENV
jgi:capsular exopolysaccharide synthesis family protein